MYTLSDASLKAMCLSMHLLCMQAGLPQTPAATAAAAAAGFSTDTQHQQLDQHHHQQQQQKRSQQELQVMYRRFLSNTLVAQFHRLSRSLPDIQSQAVALWPKYLSGAAPQQQQQQPEQQQAAGDEVGGLCFVETVASRTVCHVW